MGSSLLVTLGGKKNMFKHLFDSRSTGDSAFDYPNKCCQPGVAVKKKMR